MLDVADVFLSRNGGVTYSDTLATDVTNIGTWTWVPTLGDYAADARIKVTWHNIVNAQTVEAESGSFSFGGAAYSLVNRSSETGLSGELDPTTASAEPYGVATFSYDLPVPDLFVTHLSVRAQLYAATILDAVGAPQLRRRVFEAFVSNLPDLPVLEHRGLAAGNFDANGLWQNPGDAGEDIFLARESGARVYRNFGLDGQSRPQFEDIADSDFGGATLFNGSWCGQWADINGDGLIDLLVGRAALPAGATGADPADPATIDPAVARVFLQRDESNPAAPGFDEAAAVLGITQTTAATSLLVEDLDGDGIVEIVLGDLRSASRGGATVVLHRTDVAQPFAAINAFPASPSPSSVSGMVAIDVDRDGELDLVVARQGSGSAESAQVFRGLPGVSFEAPLDLDLGISQASVLAFDHDRNLTPDLVFSPEGSADSPRFLANFSTNGNLHFVDRTATVGLAAVGRARGAAAADFDADGRTDLYLGRPAAGQAFYFRSEKVTGSGNELPYIAVALEGGGGGNPADGSGSTVTILQNGSPLSSLSYGQPMGGSQSAQSLLFTVPDDGASYAVQVLWPEGELQIESATLNQTQQIHDATNPQILEATMVASYSPAAGGTMSMSFQWDCTRQAVHDFDRVHLSAPCFGGTLVFGPSHPDVVMECVLNGDGTEHHKLTVNNLDCTPNCVVSWWCESSTNFVTSSTSASPKTIKTKVCVQ